MIQIQIFERRASSAVLALVAIARGVAEEKIAGVCRSGSLNEEHLPLPCDAAARRGFDQLGPFRKFMEVLVVMPAPLERLIQMILGHGIVLSIHRGEIGNL